MLKEKSGPFKVQLVEGEKYFWCACGLSSNQPFCDGAHKGTGIKSIHYTSPTSRNVWLCGCKSTRNPPFCDGSHSEK